MPSSHRTRASRHRRVRWLLIGACATGLVLFSYCAFHGLNPTDAYYLAELVVAWSLAALGIAASLYVFKRGGHRQRRLAVVALALIICSLLVVTLLSRTSSPMAPSPPPPEGAEHAE